MAEEKKTAQKPFGTVHVVLLCLAFGALAAALAFMAWSNNHLKQKMVDEEQAFMDSLHVFPPIEFVDSLYGRVELKQYEDESPKVVVYYVLDSLGNPTTEVAHETHYYENHQKYIDGNRNGETREGLWYAYYPDGTVQTKGFYVNGKEQGRYTVYYSNGNVRYTGVYEEGTQVGEWRFYNEDGTLAKTETY
jgi:antitoxin component YwqK of YwqJK toxin-antitoxin module